MIKRTRGFDAIASLSVGVVAPVLVAVFAAASCSGGSSSMGTMGSASSMSGMGGGGAGAGGGAGSTTSSTGGPAVPDPPCTKDDDCAQNSNGNVVCDLSTGYCVGCLPLNDKCPSGQYCDAVTYTCASGCTDGGDCAADKVCDISTHTCVGCVVDDDCAAGSICAPNQVCVLGCSPSHACQDGATCCGDTCYDLKTNINHCGDCTAKCVAPPNATTTCENGICTLGDCEPAYDNCNGNPIDGCEWNILQEGPCLCTPGDTQTCYLGIPETLNIGACKEGIRTCNQGGTGWGACEGQVLPSPEICANMVDDDCNGQVDDTVDIDQDGWTVCNGDCCEVPGPGCPNPKLVNPGAFEVFDNGGDDDCDPSTPDGVPASCSPGEDFTGVTALDVAKAMDICQTALPNPPFSQKKWGLISATQLLANGATPNATALSDIQNKQTAILTHYGTGGIKPKRGLTMAGLSTGVMRDQYAPDYAGNSTQLSTIGLPPATYILAHANTLPSSAGCSTQTSGVACPAGTGANDSVSIRLSIRVPTNAKSFSYDFRFLSSEYWDFQCTQFNDFYLALLKTAWLPNPNANPPELPLPTDKNISFDSLKNPISVNNGFFEVCVAKGCNICPEGSGELAGTGMQFNNVGGATSWLTTDAPIVPGETMQLDLIIFDVTDRQLDSIVLLDNFRWNQQISALGTHK